MIIRFALLNFMILIHVKPNYYKLFLNKIGECYGVFNKEIHLNFYLDKQYCNIDNDPHN